MKKTILLLIITIFLSAAAWAQEIALTPDEAVMIALRDNLDIFLKAEDVQKAKLKISESQSGLFPSLSATATLARTNSYYAKDSSQLTSQTTLKEYLYKGGKTINTIKRDEYGLIVKEALLDKEKISIIENVRKAFYTLLLAVDYAGLNKIILENTTNHLNTAEQRYKSGQASSQDILSMRASLSNVNQAYEASLNQVESIQALLNNLLYLDEDVKIKPIGEFIYNVKDIAFEQAFLDAMKGRPEIRQYEAQESSDKKAIEIAKADNRPSVYASWDYYSRSHAAASTTKGWNDYNIIGVTFSWPIFDGWQTKAKVQQAIVDLKETQLNKEKAINDITLELKKAYLGLKDAIARINSAESQVELYKDNFSTLTDKYNSGISSSLDMEDGYLAYKVSVFNKSEAIYDYIIAKIDMDSATGGLE